MSLCYPEWYKVEKEAGVIIQRLSNLKDLYFYLNNPNQYIRHQAILRLNKLKPIESINILEEILNNPLESTNNKELAGWTIKATSLAHNLDLFISNPIVDKYTGEENYSDLFKTNSIIEPSALRGISFTPPPLYLGPDLEEYYLVHNQEVDFHTSLTIKEWIQIWKTNFLSASINFAKEIPMFFINSLAKILKYIWYFFKKIFYPFKEYLTILYYRKKNEIQPIQIVKSLLFYLLCILLAPIRFIRRNKSVVFGGLLLLLLYFGYKSNGYDIVSSYLNSDSENVLKIFLTAGKDIAVKAWTEAANSSNEWLKKIRVTTVWKNIQEYIFMAIHFFAKRN